MERRRLLSALAAGSFAALGGCGALGGSTSGSDPDPNPGSGSNAGTDGAATPTRTATAEPTPRPGNATRLATQGIPGKICTSDVIENFSIWEITDPAFDTSWEGYDLSAKYKRVQDQPGLTDEAVVVGLEHDGRARAYPLSVLWFHEIVNDSFGEPLLVTYCSICRSGLVASRVVDGEPTRFGVSGQLWKPPDRYITASAKAGKAFGADRWNASDLPSVIDGANLVMYDERTRSFWSQAIGEAICGEYAGTRLEILPSTLTSWGDWRAQHPATEILLPPPHSEVDLTHERYDEGG
jgi:hypothetical protein